MKKPSERIVEYREKKNEFLVCYDERDLFEAIVSEVAMWFPQNVGPYSPHEDIDPYVAFADSLLMRFRRDYPQKNLGQIADLGCKR